jgi:beta-lactamase superfamily II metal-dependent hydrolase
MDFVIDFLYVGDGDAIIIWAREPNKADFIFFLDGGNTGNGQKVVEHFNTWIKPHLQSNHIVGFINSHPHEDHINGLLEIIDKLDGTIKFAIYNDPVECISTEHKERIHEAFLDGEDADITHLYETFEQVEKLNNYCEKRSIRRYTAYSDENNFLNGALRILSPSKDFYVNLVQYFSDVDFLKVVDFSKKTLAVITGDEDTKPCVIVDEADDASPENLTSTVIQLTDSENRKYILTSDAGVDSFDYMESEGFDTSNIRLVQLPHHGSRRNINTRWLTQFNPSFYIVSAEGNVQHPRRAVINCIKRNLTSCKIYSTHTNKDVISYTTNTQVFPDRHWESATPL